MKSSLVSASIHVAVVALYMGLVPTSVFPTRRPHERPALIWNPPRTTGTTMPGQGSFGGPGRHGTEVRPPVIRGNVDLPPIQPTDCCGGPRVPSSDTAWDGQPSRNDDGRRTSGVLSADVVDVQVTPYAGAPTPQYPEALREAGLQGEVVVEFVVDTMGRADLESLQVLSTPSDRFEVSIRDALGATRYHPALVGGQRVRQRVRQGFVFSLTQR